ncbi:MAG: hypothetical protein ACFCBV_07570 [Phycisphaerales bacterium]
MAKQRDNNRGTGVVAFDHSGDRRVELMVSAGSGSKPRLSKHRDGEVSEQPRVGIAPWSQTLVRARGVDDLPGEELLRAIAVLGEGELPERVPPWRRGCGAVASSGGGRAALFTAWMGEDDGTEGSHREASYATAPAAVAYAASLSEGCVFASDASQGVLLVAANGPEGLVVRALRESSGVVATDAHIQRRLIETAAAAGLGEDSADEALAAATTPWDGRRVGWSGGVNAALERSFEGWPTSPTEAGAWMLPACAGAMALSEDAAIRALTELHATKPLDRPSVRDRAEVWLSSRRNVALACVVCALVVLFGPLLTAKAREAMLSAKVERAEELRAQYEADARTAAIYGQLDERVWPMTKMLAELPAAAPVHVVLESIRLDANAQVDIEGFVQVAPSGPQLEGPPEPLLTQYEAALNALGTLGPVTVVRRNIVGDAVEFQIAAQVERPTAIGSLPMDYAEMPLAQVLYGEGATNTATPIVAVAPTSSGRSRPTASSSRSSTSRAARDAAVESGRDASADRRPSGATGPASVDGVPAPLTDEQIAGMDRATLMTEWRVRLSASRDDENDEATRARLKAEADKLIARSREVGSGG